MGLARSVATTPSSATTPFNTPGPPSASGLLGSPPGSGVITTDMFSQALQNALAASASRVSIFHFLLIIKELIYILDNKIGFV